MPASPFRQDTMLTLLSLLLFTPLRCSTLQTLLNNAVHQSNFLMAPQPPRITASRHRQDQPTSSDSCKGIFPPTCTCEPEVSDGLGGGGTLPVESVACVNSRLTDTDLLQALQTFPGIQHATFYGNNFVEFTDRILGSGKQKSLLYLNLSNNNVLYLNQDTFLGMPSLQSLDLSENALYLRERAGDWSFLRPLRYLRRLLLKHAFRRPLVNGSAQLALLERGLRQARLKDLQFLDLSENDLDSFPPALVCATPGLSHLVLASNRLRTLHFDKQCPIELKALDLRWNRIKYFDYDFIRSARYFGPISVQAADNPFDCSCTNCESYHTINWFRSTTVVKDKETVRCRSSQTGTEAEESDSRPDSYLLYAPLMPAMYCPEKQASASHERDTPTGRPKVEKPISRNLPSTKLAPGQEQPEADVAITLLTAFDNETLLNSSANAIKPFRIYAMVSDMTSARHSEQLLSAMPASIFKFMLELLDVAVTSEALLAISIPTLIKRFLLRYQ